MKPIAGRKEKIRKYAGNAAVSLVVYAVLVCVVFLILYPLFSHISDMFKSFDDLMDKSVVFLPKEPELGHVRMAMEGLDYWPSMLNSFLLCFTVAFMQTLICTMVGYGFARYTFPLKNLIFAAVILTMLVPTQLLMPSYYLRFRFFDVFGVFGLLFGKPLNLLDTYGPFAILSFFGLGFKNGLYIYLVRQFFRNMPRELEESGRMDGAGFLRIFFQIMIPNAATIMITVFLFSFSWQWTDIYWSSLFLRNYSVLPSALSSLTDYGFNVLDPVVVTAVVRTGIILVILPVLLIYLVLQRFFIQGIERSGIVG